MHKKKMRGIKRKSARMIQRIEKETQKFPADFEFHYGYWHLHLPVAQDFIDSNQTPLSIKRLCIQTFINRADYLIKSTPADNEKYRVAISITSPNLWNSQLIIFKGMTHFDNFFNRNSIDQKWLHLEETRSIQEEWGLAVPAGLQTLGFKEVIVDEEYYHEGEIWFIGEVT